MTKRVGILGGTFDPPHIGHLIVANEVCQSLQLDEIRFMPNQEPPHKKRNSKVTNEDRKTMISLSITDHPYFAMELIEFEREGPSYTYDTISFLKERESDVEFYFIIGADMIEYLPNWYNIEQLSNIIQFVGVNRPGHSHETKYPILHVQIPDINLSSSAIRNKIKNKQSIKYLVNDDVIEYIKEHNLYGKE
ncbi:nicotinate-nucleotide adenylyltransferase [Heyndrickxia sp. NPDC080065]|uniref:nicotinate-nucleotide adenylyltransferase n=1 Tax=Heyndrickxia sp. NPDC080065 TaxID=3390568 RepID=UPI003D0078F8